MKRVPTLERPVTAVSIGASQPGIFHVQIFQREVPSNPNPGILED